MKSGNNWPRRGGVSPPNDPQPNQRSLEGRVRTIRSYLDRVTFSPSPISPRPPMQGSLTSVAQACTLISKYDSEAKAPRGSGPSAYFVKLNPGASGPSPSIRKVM